MYFKSGWVCSQIEINFPEKLDITADEIDPLVKKSKIDQFELAELFASKRFKYFYEKLLFLDDLEDMRRVFLFMQSHLIKVLDLPVIIVHLHKNHSSITF